MNKMSEEIEIKIDYEYWEKENNVIEKESTKQLYHELRRKGTLSKSVTFEEFVVGLEAKLIALILLHMEIVEAIDNIKERSKLFKDSIEILEWNQDEIYSLLVDYAINSLIRLNNHIWGNHSELRIEPLSKDEEL